MEYVPASKILNGTPSATKRICALFDPGKLTAPKILVLDDIDDLIADPFIPRLLVDLFNTKSNSLAEHAIFTLAITSRFDLVPSYLHVSPIFADNAEMGLPDLNDRRIIMHNWLSSNLN